MWNCALELNHLRQRVSGSEAILASAIRNGADLRIYTEFRYNEHVDVTSSNSELVQEVSEFRVTYLLDDRWSAGIMNLRQPISPPDSFGPRPSMSFFLYNQNAEQAIARPYLDGISAFGEKGPSDPISPPDMPKYFAGSTWDSGTNAPSSNFIYEFERYRFLVNDSWRQVLAHDENGEILTGSVEELAQLVSEGHEVKVGIRNLCSSTRPISSGPLSALDHEVFIQIGPCYFNTDQKLISAGSHPLVRVEPAIPLVYGSENWDFGWLMLRTDGISHYRRCDPYTLKFQDYEHRFAVRWFVR